MLVDYDLEVKEAKQLCQERVDNAPTAGIKSLYMVYLGMATYYAGDYEEAIKVFNQIELKRLNNVYHILILSFTAYAAYEASDMDTFNLSLERIKNMQNSVSRKYLGFVGSYVQVLEAIQNLEENPDIIEKLSKTNFQEMMVIFLLN